MNDTYEVYLQSQAWKETKGKKLAVAGFRCEACGDSGGLDVHHLTYARIFREPMEDLMVLCRKHHEAVEEFVKKQVISRVGDVAFLRAETLRFVAPRKVVVAKFSSFTRSVPKPPPKPIAPTKSQRKTERRRLRAEKKKHQNSGTRWLGITNEWSRDKIKRKLDSDEDFQGMLRLNRETFKKRFREVLGKCEAKGRISWTGFYIYDQHWKAA